MNSDTTGLKEKLEMDLNDVKHRDDWEVGHDSTKEYSNLNYW